jgi:hypothetical protein
VLEDNLPVALQVLDLVEPIAGRPEQPGEPLLALKQRLFPIVLAVQLQQVECTQTSVMIIGPILEGIEVMPALTVETHCLAVERD